MVDWSPIYKIGTASPQAGVQTVNGQGTNWQTAGLRTGDQFKAAGLSATIQSVTSNTQLVLAEGWPGANRSALAYEILRISDADRLVAASADFMTNLVPNLSSFGALAGQADRQPYFSGAGTLALSPFTAFARTFQASTGASGALNNLGAGAVGVAALQAANRGQFLLGGQISYSLGNIADDAATSVNLGQGTEGYFVFISANTATSPGGLLLVRSHSSASSISILAKTPPNLNVYSSPLSGTTGADSGLNVAVSNANPGIFYIENRIGAALPFFLHVLKVS